MDMFGWQLAPVLKCNYGSLFSLLPIWYFSSFEGLSIQHTRFFCSFVHLHNSSKFQFGTAHDHSLKSTSAHLYTTTIYILIIMYNIQVTQGKIVHATLAPALRFTKNGQTSNTKIGVQNTKLVRVSFFRPFYHVKQPIFFLSINNHFVYMQQIIVRQQCNW